MLTLVFLSQTLATKFKPHNCIKCHDKILYKMLRLPSLELKGPYMFNHDNAVTKHKASLMKTRSVKFGVKKLECLAQSLDLNPKSHLWDEPEH